MGPITGAMTGGFGDLGQAAGAGLNEYTTQMDYDKLAQFVNEAMQRGVPPQQAAQQAAQAFPGLMGGQGGGQSQRPGLQVPQMTQPNVVPNTIGPSSPVQGGGMGGGMGSLGAPQGAPPQQPQDYTVGQTSPGLERFYAAGDATRSQPRPLGTEPRDQTPLEYPETPGAGQRLPQRQIQQTSAAPSQPGRAPAQGMGGLVTPRNMPLFQVLMQRQAQKDSQQVEMRKAEETAGLRRDVEGMKDKTRRDIADANIASREAVAQLNAGVKTELGQVKNDTDVLRILTNRKNVLDALGAKAELAGDDLEFRKQKSESDNGVLKVLAGVYQASMNAAANMPAKDRKAAEERARLLYERGVDAVTGMRVTGGETVTEPTPGIFGTGIGAGEKKTKTPLGVEGPTKPIGPGGKSSETVTVVRKSDGKALPMTRAQFEKLDKTKYEVR